MLTVLHETDLRRVGLGRSGWTLKLEAFVFPFRKRQEEVEQKLPPSSFCPAAAAAIILRNLSSSFFSSFSCPFNSIHVHFSLLPPLFFRHPEFPDAASAPPLLVRSTGRPSAISHLAELISRRKSSTKSHFCIWKFSQEGKSLLRQLSSRIDLTSKKKTPQDEGKIPFGIFFIPLIFLLETEELFFLF